MGYFKPRYSDGKRVSLNLKNLSQRCYDSIFHPQILEIHIFPLDATRGWWFEKHIYAHLI